MAGLERGRRRRHAGVAPAEPTGPATSPAARGARGFRTSLTVLGLLVLGVVLGILAKMADESAITWAGDLGTHLAVWVLLVALIGRFASSPQVAAAQAAAFFVAVCTGYYGWSMLVLGFGSGREVVAWAGLAVTAVPVAAAAVRWATRATGPLPGTIMAGVAGLALSGGAVLQVVLSAIGLYPSEGVRPVQAAIDLVAALLIVVWLPQRAATRTWAAALLLPMAWLARQVTDLTFGAMI